MNLKELVMSKDVDSRTFGAYCRERRETLGKTVRGLAAELNVSAAYISDIEKGNRYAPPQEKLDKLVELLCIPDEDRAYFDDLASATRGFYEDINPYLGRQPLARVALRKAYKVDLPDDVWVSFIESIDREEERMLKALEEDKSLG